MASMAARMPNEEGEINRDSIRHQQLYTLRNVTLKEAAMKNIDMWRDLC